jgi:hypothetical protein
MATKNTELQTFVESIIPMPTPAPAPTSLELRQAELRALLGHLLEVATQPLPASPLEVRRRVLIADALDSAPDQLKAALRAILEHLLLHGSTDPLVLAIRLGNVNGIEHAMVEAAVERGLDAGLLRTQFELHNRHSLRVAPQFEDSLAYFLWGPRTEPSGAGDVSQARGQRSPTTADSH